MPSRFLTAGEALGVLIDTPSQLVSLTAAVSPTVLETPPSPDAWSPNEVLAHLRACSDVWGGHIVAAIGEDRPTRSGVNPRNWIKNTDYISVKFRVSLHAFTAQRADLLAVLEPLPPNGWSRTAIATGPGGTYERSVLYFAERLARHERTHVAQIRRLVA